MRFISDLRQVCDFLRVLRFSSINKTDRKHHNPYGNSDVVIFYRRLNPKFKKKKREKMLIFLSICSLHAQLFTLKAHRACKFKYLQAHHKFYRHELHYWPLIQTTKTQSMMMYQILCGHVNYALGKTTGTRGTDLSSPFFLTFCLQIYLFLYYFISFSLF